MKKVAFILAMALIFLIGISTVLKHKISAQTETKANNIVLWIPIDANGNVVFDRVNNGCNIPGPSPILPPDHRGYSEIHPPKVIIVQKVKKNPYCYWVMQEGRLVERCIP